jgi:hypothetical protein
VAAQRRGCAASRMLQQAQGTCTSLADVRFVFDDGKRPVDGLRVGCLFAMCEASVMAGRQPGLHDGRGEVVMMGHRTPLRRFRGVGGRADVVLVRL